MKNDRSIKSTFQNKYKIKIIRLYHRSYMYYYYDAAFLNQGYVDK